MKFNSSLLIALLIATVSSFGCKQNEVTIEGDLYFSFLRIGSFYNQPDSIIKGFTRYIDTANINNMHENEKGIIGMYNVLKKEQLLYSPFVNMTTDNDSLIILYLDKADYDKVKIYNRKDLVKEHKKIRIEVSAEPLGYNMYLCRSLTAVNKVDGLTRVSDNKFLIEDYK